MIKSFAACCDSRCPDLVRKRKSLDNTKGIFNFLEIPVNFEKALLDLYVGHKKSCKHCHEYDCGDHE